MKRSGEYATYSSKLKNKTQCFTNLNSVLVANFVFIDLTNTDGMITVMNKWYVKSCIWTFFATYYESFIKVYHLYII